MSITVIFILLTYRDIWLFYSFLYIYLFPFVIYTDLNVIRGIKRKFKQGMFAQTTEKHQ